MNPAQLFYKHLSKQLSKYLWRQPWLGLQYKKSAYKKICSYEAAPDAPFNKDFFGLRYEGNLNNSIEFNIYYYDAFEKPLLYFLRDSFLALRVSGEDQQSVFCDVGANIGQHSLFMSNYASAVQAFEPYAAVANKLKHHIGLNQIDNIQLHEVGLSDSNQQLDFYAPTGRNQGVGSFDASTVSKGNTKAGKLTLVRGDDYFSQHGLTGIVLIKMDVEGFEKMAITGLQTTFEQQRPVLVCEITYGNELSFTCRQQLLDAMPDNYELFTFNTRKADGSKARRRGARARKTGNYELIAFTEWRTDGQDNIVACPREKVASLPRSNQV
jgi:FkbM family methyltransferase